MKRNKSSVALIVALGCLSFCMVISFFALYKPIFDNESLGKCMLPPEDFSITDLIGTWIAGSPSRNDMLVIRSDGKYKQIIHNEALAIDFETDWQTWSLEYQKTGIPYLHLKGMRFCGFNPDISCEQTNGGGFDFCSKKSISTSDEGILIILGSSLTPGPPRGINLWYPLGSENTWVYTLQEPK